MSKKPTVTRDEKRWELELKGEIAPESLEEHRKHVLLELKKDAHLQGFRPGKAPEEAVIRSVGEPEILRRIRDRHGLDPLQMLYIGDALSDLQAAQAEGVPFLGRTHKGQRISFPPESAVALFSDFTDLERQWGDVLARLDLNNCADLR